MRVLYSTHQQNYFLGFVEQKKVSWKSTKPGGFSTNHSDLVENHEDAVPNSYGFVLNPQGFVLFYESFFCSTKPKKWFCRKWFCWWVLYRTLKGFCRLFYSFFRTLDPFGSFHKYTKPFRGVLQSSFFFRVVPGTARFCYVCVLCGTVSQRYALYVNHSRLNCFISQMNKLNFSKFIWYSK